MSKEAIDPDGNVIREGMTVVCHGDTWIVSSVAYYEAHPKSCQVVADRIDARGRKHRLIIGRRYLRLLQVIGFQTPRVTYP